MLPLTAGTYVMLLLTWLVFTSYVLLWAWNVHSYLNVDFDLSLGPDSPNAIGTMEVTAKAVHHYGYGARRSYRCHGEFTPWAGGPTVEVAARQLDEELCVKGDLVVGVILTPEQTLSTGVPFAHYGDGARPPILQVIGSIILVLLLYCPLVFASAGRGAVLADVTEAMRTGRWRWPEGSRIRARSLRRARQRAELARERSLRYEREQAEMAEREERERGARARRKEEEALAKDVDEVMARIHEETDRQMEQWRRAQGYEGPEGRD